MVLPFRDNRTNRRAPLPMHESPISLESLRRSRGTFADAVGLPPAVYSDAEFHRFEIDAVFGSKGPRG